MTNGYTSSVNTFPLTGAYTDGNINCSLEDGSLIIKKT